jgi:hypothetical protein
MKSTLPTLEQVARQQIRADADACLMMLTAFPIRYRNLVAQMTENLQRIKRNAEESK